MSRSYKQIYGHQLTALDGEIGSVKSFYFDAYDWSVRYLVAETGSWLTSRQVLLSPHALRNTHSTGNVLTVNLTRKQIEDSPVLEWHKPVSRQYEEAYNRYYGWPCYWQQDGALSPSSFSKTKQPARRAPHPPAKLIEPHHESFDEHLWNAQSVNGYHIKAQDGLVGQIADFILDDSHWAIGHLVVTTGPHLAGHAVRIPVSHVDRISYEESTVFVNFARAAKR